MKRDLLILLAMVAALVLLQLAGKAVAPHPPMGMASALLWGKLKETKISIDTKTGHYAAAYPQSVKDMAGKPITLSGFLVPIDILPESKHFLLSRRAPTCPFCSPGEPNEIIDVQLESPASWLDSFVTVTGTFGLMDDAELGMFFQLSNARKE